MPDRIAYLPLDGQDDSIPDAAILDAIALGAALGCKAQVTTFALRVPPVVSPVGGFLINIEGMARVAEDRSRALCGRWMAAVRAAPTPELIAGSSIREIDMGGAHAAAAAEARRFDLSLVPVPTDSPGPQDLAQALVFESGLPVVLVPQGVEPAPLDHLAIGWDGSRVAARALNDALRLLVPGGRVSVLAVRGEKALAEADPAGALASALQRRGHDAVAVTVELGGRPIAEALQSGAGDLGARLLAMGGFGHSRLRDFILGGATSGVLSQVRMPVLLSH
jgi:nucleotide-binding universal stress UspA family protein